MNINGRHAGDVINGQHTGATGRADFSGYVTPHGTIRIDCNRYPEFWVEIELDENELRELIANMHPEPTEEDDE